ncbi:MAG: hypothetical protein Q8R72_00685 [Hylemonella sp.]|nr:hypothetical protein [Hylemonella sp.]
MKKFLTTVLLVWAGLGPNMAWAHGEVKAQHGGVAQQVNDLVFELVQHASGAAIYIDDHGQAVKPAGMSGKLTVLQGGEKKDYPLALGVDRIEVPGVKLAKGARAVAVINGVGGKTVTVRFSLK